MQEATMMSKFLGEFGIVGGLFVLIVLGSMYALYKGIPYAISVIQKQQDQFQRMLETQQKVYERSLDKIAEGFLNKINGIEEKIDKVLEK